jgi:hypothetical protein
MSEASEELAERIRGLIGHRPGVTEKKMFGGRSFLLFGNMLCAAMRNGNLLARVGAASAAEAGARPHAEPMIHAGRHMTGFVEVSDGIGHDDELADWLDVIWTFVSTLPPKADGPSVR